VISASNRPYVPPQIDLLSAPVGLLHHTKVRRQREKERDRQTDRQKDRQTERERERERKSERDRQTDRQTEREREEGRERQTEREREREREKIDIPCISIDLLWMTIVRSILVICDSMQDLADYFM
jgi:sRNA-binding protein